jgi:CHASE2 domain-containing sensor protein
MSFGAERVFISYRRSDAEAIARSLYEALKARFGARRVFFDTSSIPVGEDFRRVVQERIGRSAVVIVVIGPGWVAAADERGQRLRQPDDPVRFELLSALGQGRRIVPLRVGGAPAPRAEELPPELAALAFLNMPQLHAESFDSDVNALCRQLTGDTDDLTLAVRLRALAAGAPLAAALIAVALLAATWTGAFGLLGLDDHVQRLLLSSSQGPAGDAVMLVRIDAASERLLRRSFGDAEAGAWRRDHARLIDLAARSGAAAVAFDLYFEEPQGAADAVLAEAVRRAARREPPMPVVFGFRRLEAGRPVLLPALAAAGRPGSLCLAHRGGAIWSTPLAVVAAGAPRGRALLQAARPALALAALAPGRLLEADVARRELRFDGPSPDPPLRYSAVTRQRVEFAGCATAQPGDETLDLLVRVAPAGHWDAAARNASYAELLASPGADPRLRGRVVLVGVTRLSAAGAPVDAHVVRDGFVPRSVFGVELQADAIATLASGRVPRLPTADQQLATTLLAAGAGAGAAVALYRRPRALRRATLGALSLACVGVAVWLARGAFLLDLVNALLSLWLAALAVRAIQMLAERLPRFRRLAT